MKVKINAQSEGQTSRTQQATQEIQPPKPGIPPEKSDSVGEWRKITAPTWPAASVENLQSQYIQGTVLSSQCVLSKAQGHLLKAIRNNNQHRKVTTGPAATPQYTAAPSMQTGSPPPSRSYQSPKSYKAPKTYGSPHKYQAPAQYGIGGPSKSAGPSSPAAQSSKSGGTGTVGGSGASSGGGGVRDGGGGSGGTGPGGGSGGDEAADGGGRGRMQPVTIAFALFVLVGGLMGYKKKKSKDSLIASSIIAGLLLVSAYLMGRPSTTYGVRLALVTTGSLAAYMGKGYWDKRKVFPQGVLAALSTVLTLGYIGAL
ncbi:hypothetical protein ABBQ38_000063 [Trebouxia sp. C0009 RCD-2024]